ncbi:MAG: hypothetical protein ACTHPS_16005 [Streptosporangiaceae bacterium]
MTWARLQPELATERARDRISDAEFCLYVEAVLWVCSTKDMSLRVPAHILARISAVDDAPRAAARLAAQGWWETTALPRSRHCPKCAATLPPNGVCCGQYRSSEREVELR